MRRSLLVLALALPFLAPAVQDPDDDPPAPDEEEEEEEVGLEGLRSRQERENAEMLEKLEGAWSLQELVHASSPVRPEDVFGFATFVDGYVSIVAHAKDDVPGDPEPDFFFQASISQFELTGNGRMMAASMIGHSNFSGEFDFDTPNLPRQFIIQVHEHDLFLTRTDGSKLIFRKLQPGFFTSAGRSLLEEERAGGG